MMFQEKGLLNCPDMAKINGKYSLCDLLEE